MFPYSDNKIQKASSQDVMLTPSTSDDPLAEMLLMGITDEATDANKYKTMATEATGSEEKDILRSMYLDESRHFKLLSEIYKDYTGVNVPEIKIEDTPLLPYKEQLAHNILGEVEGASFYRDLAMMFNNSKQQHKIFTFLSDEQNHAILNQYLLSKA